MKTKKTNPPKKFWKYKLLVDWGILSEEHLEETVERHDIADIEKCLNNIERRLQETNNSGVNFAILVPQEKNNELPNFLIENEEDLFVTKEKLREFDMSNYVEIWHVKRDNQKDFIDGRVEFKLDDMFPQSIPCVMELVRGRSREIHKYPFVDEGYMRFEKKDKAYPFELKESIVKNPNFATRTKDIEKILGGISHYQKRLIAFGECLKSMGIKHVAFDFKYAEGEFNFFDFDTDNNERMFRQIAAANRKSYAMEPDR